MQLKNEGNFGDPIICQAIKWHKAGRNSALATVVQTWGSSPCPVGSQLVIRDDGAFQGSVSGGCIEGEVVTEALAIIRKAGNFKALHFGISDKDAWQVGLACGGEVTVFLKNIDKHTITPLEELATATLSNKIAALIINQASGSHFLWLEHAPKHKTSQLAEAHILDLRTRFISDRSGLIGKSTNLALFARVYNTQLRMLIIGAVHIAQSLAEYAVRAGYDITVIDPRDTWRTQERFPGINLDDRWPTTALNELQPDNRTAIITLSHDPKLDDAALMAAFKTEAFYIGCLGSRKTHAARLHRLHKAGVTEEQAARIHAPVGLDIGAENPTEIAISIIAQITQTLRQRN